jgi:isopenicillin N synthase-like dioxygenase
MKWFRSNIKRVSHVALFALAIQLALSFGHFHGVAADAASATQVARSLSTPQPASDQGSGEHPGDICAICVVMAMANATLFAAPPIVVLPQAAAFAYLTPGTDLVRVNAVRAGFQPRAPPIS